MNSMNIKDIIRQDNSVRRPGARKRNRRFGIPVLLGAVLLTLSLAVVTAQPSGLRILPSTDRTSSISQYGITWHFESEVEYGQFINGDYWVVGPVTVTDVDPAPATVGGRDIHGSMVNPIDSSQAYDSESLSYNGSLRVSFPITLENDSSLLSTISRAPTSSSTTAPATQTLSVLTVLDRTPDPGSFRPPLMTETKPIYNWSAVEENWHRLADLELPAHTAIDENLADSFQLAWPLQIRGWTGQRAYPRDNLPNYHGDIAQLLSRSAATILVRDEDWDNPGQRKRLVRNLIQVGIDYYGLQLRGNGGPRANYWFPTTFAGLMLGESDMQDLYRSGSNAAPEYHADKLRWYPDMGNVGDGTEEQSPSSYFPVSNASGTLLLGDWVDGFVVGGEQDTWTGYHARTGRRPVYYRYGDPNNNDPDWEVLHPEERNAGSALTYKRMHSRPIPGFAFAALALDLVPQIGNSRYVPYADRWMYETDDIIIDSFGSSHETHPWATTNSAFIDGMWHVHRGRSE